MDSHQQKESADDSLTRINMAMGGERVLSIIIGIFTCVVAVPVFLIYFIKSPLPLQDVYIFGISYYNLVFIFLISAAGLIISLPFFFRFNLSFILAIFITSLFCCSPLIIGLKNDLTLQQAILHIPFFSSWPFFLRPLYIFVECLLPLGILIFLFLQIRSIFSKKPHSYATLGAASYLAAVAFIGFSGLLQAGQPNIMTALERYGDIFFAPDKHLAGLKRLSENHTDRADKIQSSSVISSGPQDDITEQSENALGQSALSFEGSEIARVDHRVGVLEGRIDRISKELEEGRISLTAQDRSAPAPSESLPPAVPQNAQPSHEDVLAEINHNLVLLSGKINQVVESLETLKNPASEHNQSAMVDVRQKVELLVVKLDQLLSKLNKAEYLTVQQQGSMDKRSATSSSITKEQNITSSELGEVLKKLELLSDKVDLVSDTLIQRGLYTPEEVKNKDVLQ